MELENQTKSSKAGIAELLTVIDDMVKQDRIPDVITQSLQ